MRLLMELPADAPAYFRPLAEQPRMGAALWAAIRELRLAGISPAALPRAAFEDERKHGELCGAPRRLRAAPGRQPTGRRRRRLPRRGRARGPVSCRPDTTSSSRRRPWPRRPRSSERFSTHCPDSGWRAPFRGSRVSKRLAVRRGRARDVQPGRIPARVPARARPGASARPGQRLELFHAAGREAEVEAVLRRILAASPPIPLDAVEVACAARDAAALFWEKAQRLELPVTVEQGVPVTATRPAACAARPVRLDRLELRREPPSPPRAVGRHPDRVSRTVPAAAGRRASSLKSGATWGRETYEQSLAALAARDRAYGRRRRGTGRGGADGPARQGRRKPDFLAAGSRELLGLVPVPGEDGRGAACRRGLGPLRVAREPCRRGRTARRGGRRAIADALASLLALGTLRCPMRQALAFVRDAVERLVGRRVARRGPATCTSRPSRPPATPAGPSPSSSGCRRAASSRRSLEDPVLLDVERGRISDRASRHRTTGSRNRSTRSCPGWRSCRCRQDAGAGRRVPELLVPRPARRPRDAPVLADAAGAAARGGQPGSDLRAAAGSARHAGDARCAATRAGADGRRLVAGIAEGTPANGGRPRCSRAFPSLAAGRAAADARDADAFTEWDGFVPAARALLDPRASGEAGVGDAPRAAGLVPVPLLRRARPRARGRGRRTPTATSGWTRCRGAPPCTRSSPGLCREAPRAGRRLNPRQRRVPGTSARRRESWPRCARSVPRPRRSSSTANAASCFATWSCSSSSKRTATDSEPVAFEVAFGHDDGRRRSPWRRPRPVRDHPRQG